MTTVEAAEMLNLAPDTLKKWRVLGKGPKYLRLGRGLRRPVRYRVAELRKWLRQG